MNAELILIALLEGVTEFLPVSSTAHLIIFSKIFSIPLADPYVKFYLLVIQLGALLAGVFFFAGKILRDKKLFTLICVSFIPSAVAGFVLYKTFKHLLEGNLPLIFATLFLGGVIFIYLEKVFMRQGGVVNPEDFGKAEMSKTDALVVGLAQALAIVPGVSRSGATIVAGICRGIKKSVIIEYTFLLALPTLGAAALYDAYKSREMLLGITSFSDVGLGIIVAFLSAFITLYFMKKYLLRISLTSFGVYRVLLACAVLSQL